MKKILIISISNDEQKKLEEALWRSPSKLFKVETTASFGQDAVWWTENSPDIVVLSLPSDDLMQGYFLTKLRADVPRSLAILLLTEGISANLMQLSQIFSKVRLLKAPYDGNLMLRSIVDLTTVFEGKVQAHPRYLTDQDISISSDKNDLSLNAKMKNLSLSGAYFESEKPMDHFTAGDLIKISVMVGEPKKEYLFDAKVVWMKNLPDAAKGTGCGVYFINKEEVYNHLLKGF